MGNPATVQMNDDYERRLNETWNAAHDQLIADGWTCDGKYRRLPIFSKPGHSDVILVRDAGKTNWHPRVK